MPKPDAVVFLYMPYQIGMELKKGRKGKADAHEASVDHLKNAEKAYLDLAAKYEWIEINCASDDTIKTLKTPKTIHNEVYEKITHIW